MRLLLFALAFLAILPARADDFTGVEAMLKGFVTQYENTAFGDVVQLPKFSLVDSAYHFELDVQVDPTLGKAGKYYPSNARVLGGISGAPLRNNLLKVRSLTEPDGMITVWHEFLHHLVRLYADVPDCGAEEAYMEYNEARALWLSEMARFVDRPSKGEIGYYDLRARWARLEKQFREKLSSEFKWTDSDGTCGTVGKTYVIQQVEIAEIDRKIGLRIPFGEIRDSYRVLREPAFANLGGKWCRRGKAGEKTVTVTQGEKGIDFGDAFGGQLGKAGDLLSDKKVVLVKAGVGDRTFAARGDIRGGEIQWDNGDVWKRMAANDNCAGGGEYSLTLTVNGHTCKAIGWYEPKAPPPVCGPDSRLGFSDKDAVNIDTAPNQSQPALTIVATMRGFSTEV